MRILLTGNSCFKIANFRKGLIHALQSEGHEVLVLAPRDAHAQTLNAMGMSLHELPMNRNGLSPLGEAHLLGRIFAFLWQHRPDVVLAYTIKNNIYAGLACRVLNIPFVPNVTGLGPAFNSNGLLNKVVRCLYRSAFAQASAVFFQNRDDLGVFLRSGLVTKSQTRLLPGSGVDLDMFQVSPISPDHDGVVFLLVSRMLWDKGVGLFVDAAKVLRRKYPVAHFQLLGPIDGDSRSAISPSQIKAWHNTGLINYLGELKDVRPALRAAHCIVLPSWYREGTPRVLLEAAATGRPVITTDMPGCRDAVVEGISGLLCKPQNLDSLVAEMQRFLKMSWPERAALGLAGRARAEAAFDEQIVIRAYLDVLAELQVRHGSL